MPNASPSHPLPLPRIARMRKDPYSIQLVWDDGRTDAYHYVWLRDNCACPTCRHPQTYERTFDLLTAPEDLAPAAVELAGGGALRVTWPPDGHVSVYEAGWLRAHSYCNPEPDRQRSGIAMWGAELGGNLPRFGYEAVMADDGALRAWLEALRDIGIALLTDCPPDRGAVTRIAARVAYPRATNFGEDFEVVSMPNPNSTAYTAEPLRCHTDLPYWLVPPGFQYLHCLKNGAEGGKSLFVDGFRVAEELRKSDPEAFDLLSRTPLDFRFHDETSDMRYRTPAIQVDDAGRVVQFRFSLAVMAALSVPFDAMGPVYRAHRTLAELIRRPDLELRFRLAAGETVGFDNHRVLHGRDAFDPQSGERHLQGCYVDREELLSRLRVLGG